MNKIKVCHFTTLHSAYDTRVFQKQCVSLAANGFDVTLLVANQKDDFLHGVKIINVDVTYKNRLQRFRKMAKVIFEKCLEIDADIYEFHDPELLPVGLKLQRRGKKIIYDAHEDYPLQILSKPYLPKLIRSFVSSVYKKYEEYVARRISAIIVANPPTLLRFAKINSNAVNICNYPRIEDAENVDWSEKKNEIAYVGTLTKVRGIYETVQAIEYLETQFNLAGSWHFKEYENSVKSLPAWSKTKELGYLKRNEVNAVYARSKVGISVLHPIANYKLAYSVKIFEYMAAGIPVVVSNFPLWAEVVEGSKCGICIDPINVEAQTEAIRYLLENEEAAKEMGENGKIAAQEKYNWKTQEVVLVKLYNKLVHKK